jgi:hypothetical protein
MAMANVEMSKERGDFEIEVLTRTTRASGQPGQSPCLEAAHRSVPNYWALDCTVSSRPLGDWHCQRRLSRRCFYALEWRRVLFLAGPPGLRLNRKKLNGILQNLPEGSDNRAVPPVRYQIQPYYFAKPDGAPAELGSAWRPAHR